MNSIFNSLAPGKFEWNFRYVIFKRILLIDGSCISGDIAPIWISLDFTYDQATLVQVMAWCRQATNHYLSQCWPRSLSPYGVTRPQSDWTQRPLGDVLIMMILKYISATDIWIISCWSALSWTPQDFTDDESTLVQVMGWCRVHQAITWANDDPDLSHHIASICHKNDIN